eukprot:m.197356 g.197356  ORF g.197356 m.197356 type:complete len:298 (-) comp20116_c0_seq1:123-1016(-)
MASESMVAALSAGAGGAFSSIALHPLDAVKTKMQSGDTDDKDKDQSTIGVARRMVKKGGIASLYVGVWIKAVESGLTKAMYYWIYTALGGGTFSSVYAELLAGYIAEVGNKPITLPLELVAYRMICSPVELSPLAAVRELLDEKGVMGLYSGFFASALGSIKAAIHFSIFEQIKKGRLGAGKSELGFVESFVLGAIARAFSTTITYPFIRAKVLAMTGGKSGSVGDIILEQLREGGLAGLYRGSGPEITRGVISTALMLGVKEKISGLVRQLLGALPALALFGAVRASASSSASNRK